MGVVYRSRQCPYEDCTQCPEPECTMNKPVESPKRTHKRTQSRREYQRQYYLNNKQKLLARAKQRYKENRA